MTPMVVLSIVGSIASIVGIVIAAPNAKSRALHVIYAFLLTAVAGLATIHSERQSQQIHKSEMENDQLQEKISELMSLKNEAQMLLDGRGYLTTSDRGENRGFFLAGMGFLERNKSVFPELYETAKQLGEGIRVTESSGELTDFEEGRRLEDGADAMASILKGIAGLKN